MIMEYVYDTVFLCKLGINPFGKCEQLNSLDKDSLEKIIQGIHSSTIKSIVVLFLQESPQSENLVNLKIK